MTGSVRIGDGERGQLVVALRRHFTAGRLTLQEFEERTGIVFAASTAAEAERAFVDLPVLPPETPPSAGRRRRHGEAPGVEPHWQPTSEVFRDPSTDRLMRVWTDPTDGSRHYIAE